MTMTAMIGIAGAGTATETGIGITVVTVQIGVNIIPVAAMIMGATMIVMGAAVMEAVTTDDALMPSDDGAAIGAQNLPIEIMPV